MKKLRQERIDLVRGILVVLVIVGHILPILVVQKIFVLLLWPNDLFYVFVQLAA